MQASEGQTLIKQKMFFNEFFCHLHPYTCCELYWLFPENLAPHLRSPFTLIG